MYADINNFSFQNIVEKYGIDTAIIGMSVVFLALTLVALFIAILPRVLTMLEGFVPPEEEHRAVPAARAADDATLAAAIGFALHTLHAAQVRNVDGPSR